MKNRNQSISFNEVLEAVLKGINSSATRKQILEAKEIFEELLKKESELFQTLFKVKSVLGCPYPSNIMNEEHYFWEIENKRKAFEYCVNHINKLLSPTYIQSNEKLAKLEVDGLIELQDIKGNPAYINVRNYNGADIINEFETDEDIISYIIKSAETHKDILDKMYKLI